MVFTDIFFLFAFLPIVLLGNVILQKKHVFKIFFGIIIVVVLWMVVSQIIVIDSRINHNKLLHSVKYGKNKKQRRSPFLYFFGDFL